MKLVVCEFVPETPLTVMVSFPMVTVEAAVRVIVTLVSPLADSITGLAGVKVTVIPVGAVPVRLTGSPEGCRAWIIPKVTAEE